MKGDRASNCSEGGSDSGPRVRALPGYVHFALLVSCFIGILFLLIGLESRDPNGYGRLI